MIKNMKSENHYKEIDELLKKLKAGQIIYVTNKNNNFYFIEHRINKLFFSIPNHNNPSIPNIKSVSDEQFCKLLRELIKKKRLTTEDFPFKDCRKAAFYGFVNNLFPNTFIKTRGKISIK